MRAAGNIYIKNSKFCLGGRQKTLRTIVNGSFELPRREGRAPRARMRDRPILSANRLQIIGAKS